MTRSISHEIRTPLNTAFMALELLQDSMRAQNPKNEIAPPVATMEDWLDNIDNIREACEIALGILNQLLTFDKLHSGMLQLERKLLPAFNLIDTNSKLFKMQVNIKFTKIYRLRMYTFVDD